MNKSKIRSAPASTNSVSQGAVAIEPTELIELIDFGQGVVRLTVSRRRTRFADSNTYAFG